VIEDALDHGGVLGCSGAEVPGRSVDGGVSEQGLDLGGVGATLAQPGGIGVAEPVRAQAADSGVVADGEDHLGDAGVSEPATLAGPERARLAAALIEPGGDAGAGGRGQGDAADLIALAVQPDRAGACGGSDVPGLGALVRNARPAAILMSAYI